MWRPSDEEGKHDIAQICYSVLNTFVQAIVLLNRRDTFTVLVYLLSINSNNMSHSISVRIFMYLTGITFYLSKLGPSNWKLLIHSLLSNHFLGYWPKLRLREKNSKEWLASYYIYFIPVLIRHSQMDGFSSQLVE